MACNCFDTVNKMLQDELQDPEGTLYTVWQIKEDNIKVVPAIVFEYHKLNKDKSRQKTKSTTNVTYGFCPFCGQKYETDEKKEKEDKK